MSKYYNAPRTRNLYNPDSVDPYKLSRSKVDLFLECPRCFYLDRRLGVGRPPGYPFTLNTAVDGLLKKEFDIYRAKGEKHPLIKTYGIDAVPVEDENLEDWRNNFKGVQYLHQESNLLLTGAIDDLWQNSQGEYIVVDYKATSTADKITSLDKEWHKGYKIQMEFYQWLLRKSNYKVSDTGYFVYCNGDKSLEAFDGKLEFDVVIIPYKGNTEWVEDIIIDTHRCLSNNTIPPSGEDCDYCIYREAISQLI